MAIKVRKIFKNESGESLSIFNKIVPDGESYEPDYQYWSDAANSDELDSLLSSGDIVLNNGTSDLSYSDAKSLLERWQQDEASDIVYDNTSSGLSSTTVQGVIDELPNTPVGSIDMFTFHENSKVKNEWLNYGESGNNSDESPAVAMFNCKLIGMTFSNKEDGVDVDVEIHKSLKDQGNTSNRVATFEVRNKRVARYSDFTPISFNAGDKFSVYLKDQGTDTKNAIIKLYFLITGYNQSNSGEDYSSNTTISVGGITITIG